jgi:hypothetical protein
MDQHIGIEHRTLPSSVHFTMQGKGGVGKSFVSAILAQYFQQVGAAPKCIDTDPINQTFASYRALKASHLPLTHNGSPKIDERSFDPLIGRLLAESGVFVVDNGAATFIPLSTYLLETDALALLKAADRSVFMHVVITGGQALPETLAGFKALAEAATNATLVVWLNEYFGPIAMDRKPFTEMRAYKDHVDKVGGIVRIAARNPDTFGKDVAELAAKKMTFAEALADSDFSIMSRQRLKMVWLDLAQQLDRVEF